MIIRILSGADFSIQPKDIGIDSHITSIGALFTAVTKFGLILIGMLAVIFIIAGALQMVSAAGSPQRFKNARETIIYAIVGLVISISAYAIVTFISGAAK